MSYFKLISHYKMIYDKDGHLWAASFPRLDSPGSRSVYKVLSYPIRWSLCSYFPSARYFRWFPEVWLTSLPSSDVRLCSFNSIHSLLAHCRLFAAAFYTHWWRGTLPCGPQGKGADLKGWLTLKKLVPCRNFYQKLALMHVTKIVRFDSSAVFES